MEKPVSIIILNTQNAYLSSFSCQFYTVVLEDTELINSSIPLTFPDGSTNQSRCTSIPIRDDSALEGNHAFTVEITSAGCSPHAAVNATSSTTTVTIQDDESKLPL